MLGKSIVDEREVGIDEHSCRQILADHRRDKGSRLPVHRLDEVIVEAVLGIEPDVGLIPSDMPQTQPVVGEISDEPFKVGADNQAIGFSSKNFCIAKSLRASQLQQLGIGTRVDQEVRQPRCNGIVIVGPLGFAQVEKVTRTQESLVARQHRIDEWLLRLQTSPDQPLESLNLLVRDGLARCQVHLGEFAAGLAAAERLLHLVPSGYQGHLTRAAALFELDRLDDGIAAVDRAIDRMPTDPECHLLRCRLLAALGREAEALAAAARAAELAPADSEPHLLTAHIHAGTGDRAAARAAMERVVAREPARALAHLDLGWHCLALGDAEAARTAFTRCIELAPSEASGHDALGLWHQRHGDRDEALRLLQRAVELDPQLGSARVNLAALRWELGDRDGSVQGYRDAVAFAPDLDSASEGLVFVLQRTGQGAAAIAERRRWADQHPGSPVVWLRLVKTCLDAKPDDLAQAATALERATTAAGEPRADLFYWRARVAERRGDEAAAVRALYEQALAAPKCNAAMRREIEGRLQQGR